MYVAERHLCTSFYLSLSRLELKVIFLFLDRFQVLLFHCCHVFSYLFLWGFVIEIITNSWRLAPQGWPHTCLWGISSRATMWAETTLLCLSKFFPNYRKNVFLKAGFHNIKQEKGAEKTTFYLSNAELSGLIRDVDPLRSRYLIITTRQLRNGWA